LFDCKLSRSTLMQLAQVSTITHLELLPAELHAQRAGPRVDPDAVKQMLQGMPNLAHLKLACAGDDANLIPALPALSLTALTLGLDWESERPNFPDSASQLVHLRTLALHRAVYSPSALAGLTLLTQLSLRSCQPAPPGLDAATAFLEAVRGMRHLQHLAVVEAYDAEALYGVSDEDVAFLRAADPRACAALTAASQLTCLEICCEYGQPLPAAALQHMFPAGTQLSRLQHLMVSASDYEHAGGIRSADLRSAVGACPALHHLSLHGVLAADVDVDVLLELPSTWRSLAVGGAAFGDRAVPVIAQLTQLTSLQWGGSPGLMAAGLVPLTQLRALQTCCVPVADLDGIRHGFSGVRHLTAGEKERCQPGFCPVFW
jgi:hypothetical protein